MKHLRKTNSLWVEIGKVFGNPNLVRKIVLKSGSSLRELMRLVQEACIETMGEKVDGAAIEKAIVNVRTEFVRPMPQAFFAELARIHKGKQTDNSPAQRSILFYRYALEYNGDRWVDVHPLIHDLPEFKREIENLTRGKKARKKKARKRG